MKIFRQYSLIKTTVLFSLISLTGVANDSGFMIDSKDTHAIHMISEVATTATSLFNGLTTQQSKKSNFKMNSKEMAEWRYFPNPSRLTKLIFPGHHGLSISELNSDQKNLLKSLLQSGLSQSGLDAVNAALTLDKDNSLKFRGFVDWLLFDYNPNNYYISIFGQPTDSVWAWRFEGHHISLTFNVSNVNHTIKVSPAFIGTTMNKVVIGTKDGAKDVEPLKPVIENIKLISASLDADQVALATQSLKKVPQFNLFAPGLFGGPLKLAENLPLGLPLSKMTDLQKKNVLNILAGFQTNFSDATSAENLASLKNENFDNIEIVWAGDLKMVKPFYIRVQGATFVFELTCSENNANHYHSSWINR